MRKIVRRDTEAGAVAPAKIIEREVVSAVDEGRRILEKARAEADSIVAAAETERDRVFAEAREAGRAEGLTGWLAEADRLRTGWQMKLDETKPQMIRLALRVAEKILRQKLDVSPEAVVPMLDEALRSLRAQSKVVLRVHPDDRPLVESQRQRWLERHPAIPAIDVVRDDGLARGGCRIETEFGMVDATIENQIRAMERLLLGDAREGGS